MNEYTDITEYYDALMTSGYYDYDAIALSLISVLENRKKILELGVGTGLIAQKLLQFVPDCQFTGIDFTGSMLALARKRLPPQTQLLEQDVTHMEMPDRFEAAFGNGGVWGFVSVGDEYSLVSHLTDTQENIKGLRCVNKHLEEKALFIMSVQPSHKNFERELPKQITYSQEISENEDFIEKDYIFKKEGRVVAHHRNRFRLFRGDSIKELMLEGGFEFQNMAPDGRFHVYVKIQ